VKPIGSNIFPGRRRFDTDRLNITGMQRVHYRTRRQKARPAGAANIHKANDEGSGTEPEVLKSSESIAKSPPKGGGLSMPKTSEVIAGMVSSTPMKIAEPSSSDVEFPSSVKVPMRVVPAKAWMVAVNGPELSSWIKAPAPLIGDAKWIVRGENAN
jgi:hypothetical protein